MPTTKNALIRYKYLDKLLSDRHHYYSIRDLTDKVNDMMDRDELDIHVVKRTIEKDLLAMQCAPFSAPIESIVKNGRNIYRYSNSSFSIFSEELSSEERCLLHEVLKTLGQFEGLAHFEWLDKFKIGLGLDERKQIISFSNNPYLKNSNMLGTLFDYISNEVVIRLTYHKFKDKNTRNIILHPYLLKQYRDRWFLLGAVDGDKCILTFAMDRIENVEPLPDMRFAECPEDISERFEDIIGVTFYADQPVEHILFWMSDNSKDYVITKPIHGSQTPQKGEREQLLREQYPQLEGGAFFTIDCIKNYELIRELCSFGKDLLVLEPSSIHNEVFERICEMKEDYSKVRT